MTGEASEFLSLTELRDLTQRASRELQKQELDALGIPYIVQRGRIVVSRFHVRERLEGKSIGGAGRATTRVSGINWAAVK